MEQPEQQQRQQAKRPNEGPPKRCPRCESTNTKFCYFNNYSASQPRHFCKTCRRYWTEGGSLRNIPNEGGCGNRRRRSRRSSPAAASTSAAVATINPSDRPLNNNDQGPPAAAKTMADHAHSQVPPSLYLWTGDLADTRRVGGGLETCTAALRSLNSEASHLGGFQASPLRMPPSLNYPLLFGFNYHVPQQQQQQQLGFHVSGGDRTLHQLPPVNNTNLKVQPRPSTSVAQRGWELSTTPLQQRLTTSATTPATTPDGATAGAGADSFWTDLFTGVGGSGHWASELSGPAPRANSPSSFI